MLELIGGGARSGKSRAALARAEPDGNRYFIATATADDAAMQQRIEQHRRERDASWQVIEAPRKLADVITRFTAPDQVVIDCLSLWLCNWLCSDAFELWPHEKQQFLHALKRSSAHIIMVTNEVGQGVVPNNALSREFVDQLGWLHQDIAALCQRVVVVQFGIEQVLRGGL